MLSEGFGETSGPPGATATRQPPLGGSGAAGGEMKAPLSQETVPFAVGPGTSAQVLAGVVGVPAKSGSCDAGSKRFDRRIPAERQEWPMPKRTDPESVVREIKRKTGRKFSSEEKIRIVLEELRSEESIAEPCGRDGISST